MTGLGVDAAGAPPWSRSLPCGGHVYPERKAECKFRLGGTGRHRAPPLPQVCRKHARGTGRQSVGWGTHSRGSHSEGRASLTSLMVASEAVSKVLADGQAGGAREVSVRWARKEDMRWARPVGKKEAGAALTAE